MMKQETIQAYTIDQHPNKEAVFDWVRDNWHDLGQFSVEEMAQSLKELALEVRGKLDYQIGIFPDRSEHVSIKDYDANALERLLRDVNDYPLTGCWSDDVVINGLVNGDLEYQVLKVLHEEGEYLYSDKGIQEYIDGMEFYFTEDGAFHS